MLSRVKDSLAMEKQSIVLYWISCSCGKAYVGELEIVRRLETRMKEHPDAYESEWSTWEVSTC